MIHCDYVERRIREVEAKDNSVKEYYHESPKDCVLWVITLDLMVGLMQLNWAIPATLVMAEDDKLRKMRVIFEANVYDDEDPTSEFSVGVMLEGVYMGKVVIVKNGQVFHVVDKIPALNLL